MVKIRMAALAAVAVAAVGCQMGPVGGGTGPVALRPTGVEGSWVYAADGSVSRFAGGSFVTTASDTRSKLSEGSYRYRDARTVEITMTSLIRNNTQNVACSLATPSQLNCTSSTGSQFVLTRRTGVS